VSADAEADADEEQESRTKDKAEIRKTNKETDTRRTRPKIASRRFFCRGKMEG
jgi:hypothetical protein